MSRTAALLDREGRGRKGLPALLAFTDPARTPDVLAFAEGLPRGAGVVYRAFGSPRAREEAAALAALARRRGLVLLVGADAGLAAEVGAAGVHLPERAARDAGRLKARRPGWIVTAAAHSLAAARRAARAGADAAVVSAVFESGSPSAGRPLGAVRLAGLTRQAGGPVYALGGVNARTAARLRGLGLAGLAGVDGFRSGSGFRAGRGAGPRR